MSIHTSQQGFTVVELLVVIAIVGILSAVVYTALDPTERLAQARDAIRLDDVEYILTALEQYVQDNGQPLDTVARATAGNVYMIVGGDMASGCHGNNAFCRTDVTSDASCMDLSALVGGYLERVPVSPQIDMAWDQGLRDGDNGTGYTLEREVGGTIRIRACESDSEVQIEVSQ